MKEKTIKDAVKMLPPQYRERVIKLWEVSNCMDLYNGELGEYLDVIIQRMEYLDKRLNKKMEALQELKARVAGFIDEDNR